MKLYIMDTDVVGFAFQQHSAVLERIRRLAEDDLLVTTIVTFGEDLSGWLPACKRARDGATRAEAYTRLERGLDFYRNWICLPFDTPAAAAFERLRARKPRIGTNDLSIAAIALSVGGILVTRNIVDFQRITELPLEDWTA